MRLAFLIAPLVVAALALAPRALAQAGHADAGAVRPREDVGARLDRFLERATDAASAASLVVEADRFRRDAHDALAGGRRDEARALLRRAGEAIAAAAPDGDERADDPFVQQYLGELMAEIDGLDASRSPGIAGAPALPFEQPAGRLGASARLSRGRLAAGLARLAGYRPMMARVFGEEGVPEWLLAVGLVESGYSTGALSPKGALGIWQFIPATADRFGLKRTATFDERQHPVASTRAAARYLRSLYVLFGDWRLALAAYNAGEGRIARVIHRTGIRDFDTMAARGLLPAETIDYVPKVLAAARWVGPPQPMRSRALPVRPGPRR